jgi:restriction endonuclease Mrr
MSAPSNQRVPQHWVSVTRHMPMPKAKETMVPILDVLADGGEHLDEEIQEEVARYFRLTKREREARLKNGIPIYKNRTAWGLVYLQDPKYLPDTRPYIEKTGLRSGQEVYRITRAGMAGRIDRLLHGD